MYLDGYSSYFRNNNLYKAAQQMDKAGGMHFVMGTSYEIESWMDVDVALANAVEAKKYASKHVKTNWLKLYMDGTVESGTGFIEPLYNDGRQGLVNWSEDEFTCITRKANGKGLTINTRSFCLKMIFKVVSFQIYSSWLRYFSSLRTVYLWLSETLNNSQLLPCICVTM